MRPFILSERINILLSMSNEFRVTIMNNWLVKQEINLKEYDFLAQKIKTVNLKNVFGGIK